MYVFCGYDLTCPSPGGVGSVEKYTEPIGNNYKIFKKKKKS